MSLLLLSFQVWINYFSQLYQLLPSVCVSVSALSILMVAVYQFITIRVDPFGSRHLITTPRCIGACVLCWALPFIFFFAIRAHSKHDEDFLKIYLPLEALKLLLVFVTGITYFLVYHSVTKSASKNPAMRGRQGENKRLLRTYLYIYGTTLVGVVFAAIAGLAAQNCPPEHIGCYYTMATIVMELNALCNVLIYWLRLKEFRSLIPKCRRQNRIETVSVDIAINPLG